MEARGLSQSPFLRHYLLSYFEIGSHWLGVQPLGESRWPVSLRDLCSPASSGLGLQVCAVTPDFYVGCLHHPLGPCVYPIGTSLTVLSPQPQVFCFCSFVGLFQATRQSEWGFQSVAASCTRGWAILTIRAFLEWKRPPKEREFLPRVQAEAGILLGPVIYRAQLRWWCWDQDSIFHLCIFLIN